MCVVAQQTTYIDLYRQELAAKNYWNIYFILFFIKKSILFFSHEIDYFSSSFYTTIPPKTGLLYMCASRNIFSSFSHHHEMIVHGWQDVKIQLLTYLTNLLLFPAFTFNSGEALHRVTFAPFNLFDQ